MEKENASAEEIEKLGIGGLKRAFLEGDTKTGSLMAGQSAAMVKDIKPCSEIIKDYFDGIGKVLEDIKNKF